MDAKKVYEIINNKYSISAKEDKDKHFTQDIKNAIDKGINIKASFEEIKEIIKLNYRYNKVLIDKQINILIENNKIDRVKLLKDFEE